MALKEILEMQNAAQLAEMSKEVATLNYAITSKNLFDKSATVVGEEVYNDGSFAEEANSARSDYIVIPPNDIGYLYLSGLPTYETGLSSRYSTFYDSNKVPLGSNINISKTLTEKSIAIPENAAYFAFSIYQRKASAEVVNLDILQVEIGETATNYEPYGKASWADNLKVSGKSILLFGDSVTETATISEDGATYTEGTRDNWPIYTKANLQLGTMYNYARSGATYKDQSVVDDVRRSLSQQITLAIANSRPADIIVVACGTNDGDSSLGTYATAIEKATLETLDKSLIYEAIRWAFWTIRANYPNAVCFAATPIQRAAHEQSSDLLDAITIMANRYNFILVDAYGESGIVREFEASGANGRYLKDGLHPNTAGQVIMSKLFNRKIMEALNDAS